MEGYFSIVPGQKIKQTHIWGLGNIIGERQETIVQESDYEDMDAVAEAIMAYFAKPDIEDTEAWAKLKKDESFPLNDGIL